MKKEDLDIKILHALRTFLKRKDGILFIVSGGYAVEAYLGGSITRSHKDMDASIYLSGRYSKDELIEEILDVISEITASKWKSEKKSNNWIMFVEDVKEGGKLDLHIYNYAPTFQTKKLIDSSGKNFEVDVEEIEEVAAVKIALCSKRQDYRPEEVFSLRVLLKDPQFNKMKCLERIVNNFHFIDNIDWQVAQEKAEKEFKKVKRVIEEKSMLRD